MSVSLPEGEPSVMLFSETPARAIVSLCGNGYREFKELCQEHGVPTARIGEVIDHGEIEVNGLFSLPLTRSNEPGASRFQLLWGSDGNSWPG